MSAFTTDRHQTIRDLVTRAATDLNTIVTTGKVKSAELDRISAALAAAAFLQSLAERPIGLGETAP